MRYVAGRDIRPVVETGSPDITDLIEKDAIQDKSVPAQFNQIDNIPDIGGRVRNRFDILEYNNSVMRIRGARKKDSPATKQRGCQSRKGALSRTKQNRYIVQYIQRIDTHL